MLETTGHFVHKYKNIFYTCYPVFKRYNKLQCFQKTGEAERPACELVLFVLCKRLKFACYFFCLIYASFLCIVNALCYNLRV